MKFSTDGIRTTHGGNLPGPADFDALLQAGTVVSAAAAERLPEAVQSVVDRQVDTGLNVINDGEYVKADVDALTKALAGKDDAADGHGVEGFVAALGPLSLGASARNEYYSSEEEYMTAVAECIRGVYRAIAAAGLIVQVDEPEFATS